MRSLTRVLLTIGCLAIGARRGGRSATVLERLGQGGDHPVPAAFPEGIYLSTLIAELGAR